MMEEPKTRKKEQQKTEELVFDRRTLLTLGKLMNEKAFDGLEHIIAPGKEASVYLARSGNGHVAVKIYRRETSRFIKKIDYLQGDPRFRNAKLSEQNMVKVFAQKEFRNLLVAEKAGVDAPRPINQRDNVIVMSFLGVGVLPFARMSDVRKEVIEEDFNVVIDAVKRLWKGGIVHADLSEYNILLGDKPYIIDMSEGVSVKHPKAREFLARDLFNLSAFFKKSIGLNSNPDKLFKEITGVV
jgi:RIO kinase 1